ncbi:MAG: hypothetical protein HYX87_08440 [Chloroflexi bacterium]|nr:hypothetical protein [Chloroflexota bacterium]
MSNVDPTTGGKGPFTAVRNNLWGNGAHSLPYSVVFGFQGRRIEVTFVDAASGGEAVTDHVSAWVGDLSPESDPITMTAYDRDSKVIGQSGFTSQPSGMLGVGNFGRVEIRAAGIYRVVFTDADPSGADLDDLTFNPPTRLPP